MMNGYVTPKFDITEHDEDKLPCFRNCSLKTTGSGDFIGKQKLVVIFPKISYRGQFSMS